MFIKTYKSPTNINILYVIVVYDLLFIFLGNLRMIIFELFSLNKAIL